MRPSVHRSSRSPVVFAIRVARAGYRVARKITPGDEFPTFFFFTESRQDNTTGMVTLEKYRQNLS